MRRKCSECAWYGCEIQIGETEIVGNCRRVADLLVGKDERACPAFEAPKEVLICAGCGREIDPSSWGWCAEYKPPYNKWCVLCTRETPWEKGEE